MPSSVALAFVPSSATAEQMPPGCAHVVPVADPETLATVMRGARLTAANAGARLVMQPPASPDGAPLRVAFCPFDVDRPRLSARDVAAVAASAGAAPAVCVSLELIPQQHKLAVMTRCAKQAYDFTRYKSAARSNGGSGGGARRTLLFKDEPTPEAERRGTAAVAALTHMYRAADLENEPANRVTPKGLAEHVAGWFRDLPGVETEVLQGDRLRQERMGLVIAVGQGAAEGRQPAVLVVRHEVDDALPTVCLVGKGVVFDTGGLVLKTYSGMQGMQADKSGAAVAACVMRHLLSAGGGLAVNLVAVLPFVENAVSATAMRPGDVYEACDGQRVEINDTDAEGRLILADAMAYCARFRPACIVDFATLTGWATTVHCDLSCAFFTASDELAGRVERAGDEVGELCWRLPKWTEYAELVDSRVADVKNAGWGCSDSDAYMASMFMFRFVPESARALWLHLDVAGNAADGTSTKPWTAPFVGTGVMLGVQVVAEVARMLGASVRAT